MDFKNKITILFAKLAVGNKLNNFDLNNPEDAKVVEYAIFAYLSGMKASFSVLDIQTRNILKAVASDVGVFIDPDTDLTCAEKKRIFYLRADAVREAFYSVPKLTEEKSNVRKRQNNGSKTKDN